MTPQRNKVGSAILAAVNEWPYAAKCLLTILVRETEKAIDEITNEPTLGLSRHLVLYYHPVYVDAHTVAEIKDAVLEQVCHILLKHYERAKEFGVTKSLSRIWALSATLSVHEMLESFGQKTGTPFTADAFGVPKNQTTEQYYTALSSMGNIDRDVGGGSCVDGELRPWEEDMPDDEFIQQDNVSRQFQEDVKDNRFGNAPGSSEFGVVRARYDMSDPLGPFIRRVRGILTASGNDNSTYARPGRFAIAGANGATTPSRQGKRVEIVVIHDTSGSMGQADHLKGDAVVRCVAKRLHSNVRVLLGDTTLAGEVKVSSLSATVLRGGGGTDMANMIDIACMIKPRPDLIVVTTDGDTPWPYKQPPVPVLVCLTRKQAACPPFLHHVNI